MYASSPYVSLVDSLATSFRSTRRMFHNESAIKTNSASVRSLISVPLSMTQDVHSAAQASLAVLRTAPRSLHHLPSLSGAMATRHRLLSTALRQSSAQPLPMPFARPSPRTFFSFSRSPSSTPTHIRNLQDMADARPRSASAQVNLYRELLESDPVTLVRRYQSGKYASNETAHRIYVRALVDTGMIDKVPLTQLADQHGGTSVQSSASSQISSEFSRRPSNSNSGEGGMFGSGDGDSDSPLGTEQNPVSVRMGTRGGEAWKTFRSLLLVVFILSGAHALLDDRGIGRGLLGDKEAGPLEDLPSTTFDDVCGVDEAKEELQEIVEFLRDPKKFSRLGAKLPKGVLMLGPPGTGKTLLARAIAGEAGVPFFHMSGSEFEEVFVGVGARRVRDLFAAAKLRAPCIIFLDEIDAMGGKRNPKDQSYARMTLNQLLVELDGFKEDSGVIVIGATNFPDLLDPALIRPGRFDSQVTVGLPDMKGRKEILQLHSKKITLDDGVDLGVFARLTIGFSGAQLANLVNQAALRASVEGDSAVKAEHFQFGFDRIFMGAERKTLMDEKSRKLVAFHEGGHALVAVCLANEGAQPIHKATILPRGQALGAVYQIPETDLSSWTYKQLSARLAICMGGRAAEELIFGRENVTSGASSDFQQGMQIAHQMVTKFGMSEKVGKVVYDDDSKGAGPATKALIDAEIKALVDGAYTRAHNLLVSNRAALDRVANALLEHETLSASQINAVIKNEKININ